MAYMRHDCFGDIGISAAAHRRTVVVPALSPLEAQVVALAAREPLSSLSTGRRPIAQALFGIVPAKALADPRLEALRRFVVLHRHSHRKAQESGEHLIGLGFAAELLDRVRAQVMPRENTAMSSVVAFVLIAVLITAAVALAMEHIDALLPATVIGLAICLPIVATVHGIVAPSSRAGSSGRSR